MGRGDFLDTAELFAQASEARETAQRTRVRKALALSVGVAVIWLVFVTVSGHWGRVTDRAAAAEMTTTEMIGSAGHLDTHGVLTLG